METAKSLMKKTAGFTLIEVLFAVVLVGLVIAALAASSGAYTMYNAAGLDLSTAEFLIEEIRELMATLPVAEDTSPGLETGEVNVSLYDDVDDFRNRTYNPPIGADRAAMPEFSAFSQQISVDKVNPADLTVTLLPTDSSDLYRVTVTIRKSGRTISTASWVRASY